MLQPPWGEGGRHNTSAGLRPPSVSAPLWWKSCRIVFTAVSVWATAARRNCALRGNHWVPAEFFSSSSLCYQDATNYKCNLANQRCCWSGWGNHKLLCAGSLFITTSPDSPFPSHLAVGTSPSLHYWGIMGVINLTVVCCVCVCVCISGCRTGHESLIRFSFRLCVLTFTRALGVLVSVRGLICTIPAWKLNIHIFCLFPELICRKVSARSHLKVPRGPLAATCEAADGSLVQALEFDKSLTMNGFNLLPIAVENVHRLSGCF